MKYLGTHSNRKTYYLELTDSYVDELPHSNWVCFAIANQKPSDKPLEDFIRASIHKDVFEFKGFGLFGGYLHMDFDETMVQMEILEGHPEISVMTTGNNETDLANAFWDCYGATCLPDRTDYERVKIICVSFDGEDYSEKLSKLITRFNENWLPDI